MPYATPPLASATHDVLCAPCAVDDDDSVHPCLNPSRPRNNTMATTAEAMNAVRAATRVQAVWRGWCGRDRAPPPACGAGCIAVVGPPGAGKTWTLRRAAMALQSPTSVVSVGGIGSGATVTASVWPRTGCKCGGSLCDGHDTPGTNGFRPSIKKAATLSADGQTALLGDFEATGDGIDVGFEAAGAYRAWWARDVLLPFVVPALRAHGVKLVATEALFLSERTIRGLAETFGSDGRLTLLELSTPLVRCERQYSARPGTAKSFQENMTRCRRRLETATSHLTAAKFSPPTKRQRTLSAASAAEHVAGSLRCA